MSVQHSRRPRYPDFSSMVFLSPTSNSCIPHTHITQDTAPVLSTSTDQPEADISAEELRDISQAVSSLKGLEEERAELEELKEEREEYREVREGGSEGGREGGREEGREGEKEERGV